MTHPDAAPPDWGPARTKQITWWGIEANQRFAQTASGRDYVEAMRAGRLPPPPIASTFGLELASVGDGEVVFTCTPDESMINPLGLVHGGVLCTVLDSAMGVAVQTRAAPGVGYATIELKVSFLRPTPFDGRPLEVRGTVIQIGRRIAFAEARAHTADGTPVGHATSSLAAVGG